MARRILDPNLLGNARLHASFRPLVGTTITLRPLARYGVAVAAAAATLALMVFRVWLDPRSGVEFGFIMCMPAIMLSGWFGGWGPGILSTLLCATAAYFWLLEPVGTWKLTHKGELLGVVLLLFVGAVVSALNEAWRRSVVAAARSEAKLRATLDREREAHEAEQAARLAAETAAEQLRIAFEAGHMGTWEYILPTGRVKLSRTLESLRGYEPGAFPGTFEAFQSQIHSEDRARVLHSLEQAVRERRPYREEYRIVRADGSVRWVEGHGQPFLNAEQHPERLVGVCADITERKLADERFRIAIEAAPTTMLLVDQQGTIVFANAIAEQLLGYAPHELTGKPIDLFLPPRFRAGHADYRRRFFADASRRPMGTGRDLYALRRDGSEVPVEIGLSPIETPEGFFVLAAVTDISERKRTERLLRAQTEELQRVLEVIPVAVWIAKDTDCRQIVGNRAAAELMGVPGNQNVSQTPPPGDRAVQMRHFRSGRELSPHELPLQMAVATASAQPPGELEVELQDGRRITMLGSATPLLDERGRVRGAVAAFSDITERKQGDRQKDEFLALLGHELRNPLAPISTASELLSHMLAADSRAVRIVDIIKRQVAQLTRLVDDLLDIGRITQGRIQLQQVPLELTAVIAQAVETVDPRLRQKQHELIVVGGESPLYVHGDFTRLVQCIGNVLANAVKYTQPNGRIRVETRGEGAMAVITVSDTGVGIAPELLPRIFDLFVQGDRTLDRAEGGLGIGLSVVKRLIQMHGGEVTAQSGGLGTGTTVEIRLPRIPQPAASSAASIRLNVPPRRVLIVDDNADAAESLAMLLKTAGHQTAVALGGPQALEAVESFRPEVALVDIGLPEINGYELARRLRADVSLNGLRLVAVTGYGQVEDRQRSQAAGFDHHLVKPVDFAALQCALATVCAGAVGHLENGKIHDSVDASGSL